MVEFAFGAVGTNPHYGTPKNPWDRKAGAFPAVLLGRGGIRGRRHVRDGPGHRHARLDPPARGALRHRRLQADAAPRLARRRVPALLQLDSIGPLANTIACCAAYDALLAGEADAALPELPAKGLRLLLPRSSAIEDLDPQVAKAFEAALSALASAGALVEERKLPALRPPGRILQERRLRRRRGVCDPQALARSAGRLRPARRQARGARQGHRWLGAGRARA
jgi:aspartyl-tRNA(Asn)/glutamyl-tRNA(Gln) amidotransferase subunit A